MDTNSLADWSLGVKVVLCSFLGVFCDVLSQAGGAYMPSFGMCAAIPTTRTMPSLRVVRRHHKTTSAPPGKLNEKSERRKSRRVSGKRDSALPHSEIPFGNLRGRSRYARN